MKEELIHALAREYAEEATKADASDPNLSDSDLKGIKRDIAEYAEEVLRFLLRRFFLVDKRRVMEEYKKSILAIKIAQTFEMPTSVGKGRKELLESLFPEI